MDIGEIFKRGVEKIYPSGVTLARVLAAGKKLKIYHGIDPSSPKIHLGNAVPLRKLRQFQDLGHKVILLIGDFTGRIGDPSDKTAMRPQLTHQQVLENAKTYKEQAAKILDFTSKNNPCKIKFNSAWLDKLTNREVAELAGCFTVQQLIERDLFQRRLKEGKPIGLHEFLYPLYQGYDSVAMDVDMEIGGQDQTFNMLVGRDLVKIYRQKEKFVLTTPLLEGTDGRKMSKSWGNVIDITDDPNDMYGKTMSIRDELIIKYFTLCTNISLKALKEIENKLKRGLVNPMDLKKRLAKELVTIYHSGKEAQKAQEEFERVVQKQKPPTKIPIYRYTGRANPNIIDLLIQTNLVPSRSLAKRLVEQGGVEINDQKVTDTKSQIAVKDGLIIKAGKRKFVKIRF